MSMNRGVDKKLLPPKREQIVGLNEVCVYPTNVARDSTPGWRLAPRKSFCIETSLLKS